MNKWGQVYYLENGKIQLFIDQQRRQKVTKMESLIKNECYEIEDD